MPTNDPDYYRNYYLANRERIRAMRRVYYLRNQERLVKYQHDYYRNKVKAGQPVREYHRKPKVKVKAPKSG